MLHSFCHFRAQKSLNFQGPPLPMALVIDVANIKIIMSRAIQTTCTLIVIPVKLYSRNTYLILLQLLVPLGVKTYP